MKILFQGDSITDAGSYGKENDELTGYTKYTAELLGKENDYYNRAVSGNRAINVLERYDADIKSLQFDVFTLLIGINDVWRMFDSCLYEDVKDFKEIVRTILTKVKDDFPNAKIILLEPYLVHNEQKEYFRPVLSQFIQAIRELAVEYADGFVPLDGLFAKASLNTDILSLSEDGVHPNVEGQKLIAKYLAEEIKKINL